MCTSCGDAPLTPDAAGSALGKVVPSRRAVLGGVLGAGALSALGISGAGPAAAAVARPSIISCATWGAAPARASISMVGPPQKIIVHHMDSVNVTDYSLSAAYSIARNCQSWHFARGWDDTGQQFSISRGGYILEGRHRSIEGLGNGSSRIFPMGSHIGGQNSTSIGIENEGRYMTQLPPAAQWNKLVDLCAYLCQTYGLTPSKIYGHRDFNDTDCPGDALYARLPALRSAVSSKIGGPTTPPPTRTWPVLEQGDTGFRVTAAQYLLRHSGRTLAVDGSFGPGTRTAVVSFQASKGLVQDGAIGRLTWESPLAVTVRQGNSSNAVRALQTCLKSRGYSLTVDGSFGPATLTAVKNYQSAKGLETDGIVGPNTWAKLLY